MKTKARIPYLTAWFLRGKKIYSLTEKERVVQIPISCLREREKEREREREKEL